MKKLASTSVVALLLAAGGPASAQAHKFSGLIQAWYTQMMDSNLRTNTKYHAAAPYINLPESYTENGLWFKRVDLKVAGAFGDVDYEVMIDPTITGGATILQDATVRYKLPYGFEIKAGQFKTQQTMEALTPSGDILLAERAMLVRHFGDVRDRGFTVSKGFGGPDSLGGRMFVGMFNGQAKVLDANAQKEYVARLEMNYGKKHFFGAYALQGSTSALDRGGTSLMPPNESPFGPDGPTNAEVLDNRDATSNIGAFYRFQDDKYHASLECITGTLGKRYPTLGVATAQREHLDQSFMGYVGTLAYTMNKHKFVLRYDHMNYNSGDQWYGATNPYLTQTGDGAVTADYSPAYTETTLGYIYSLADRYQQACIRVNYILRSKNFLLPGPGQTGEQGGDTLVVAFQMGF